MSRNVLLSSFPKTVKKTISNPWIGYPIFIITVVALPSVISSQLGTELIILGLFALSFNLMLGFGGLLSFGHALFFGIGAYFTSLLIIYFGMPLIPALLLSGLVGFLVSWSMGPFVIPLGGLAFAMITLGFSELGSELAILFADFTGGQDGLTGIYRTSFVGLNIVDSNPPINYYIFTATISVIIVGFVYLISQSPYGRVLNMIRVNEDRTEALGVNTSRVKISVFSVAGGIASISGGLWAAYLRFINTDVLHWHNTGDALIGSLIGGTGTVLGPIIGIGGMRVIERQLFQASPGLYNITVGVLFISVMLFAREGIVGKISQISDRLGRTEDRKYDK